MTNDVGWGTIPGETPIDDISGLLVKGIVSRRELNQLEFEQAARLHHRSVTIHPFLNGNGRWAWSFTRGTTCS